MAGRGMSLASIISASQSGASQAMSMAEQERNKNPDYSPPTGRKPTLDPSARRPGQGQQALLQEQLLLNQMDVGSLMADLYKDSSMIANLINNSGPNAQAAFSPLSPTE